jgi:archaellum component FlaC
MGERNNMQLNFVKTKYEAIREEIEQVLKDIESFKDRFTREPNDIKSAKKAIEGIEAIQTEIKKLNKDYVLSSNMDAFIDQIKALIRTEEEPIKESNYMALDRFLP